MKNSHFSIYDQSQALVIYQILALQDKKNKCLHLHNKLYTPEIMTHVKKPQKNQRIKLMETTKKLIASPNSSQQHYNLSGHESEGQSRRIQHRHHFTPKMCYDFKNMGKSQKKSKNNEIRPNQESKGIKTKQEWFLNNMMGRINEKRRKQQKQKIAMRYEGYGDYLRVRLGQSQKISTSNRGYTSSYRKSDHPEVLTIKLNSLAGSQHHNQAVMHSDRHTGLMNRNYNWKDLNRKAVLSQHRRPNSTCINYTSNKVAVDEIIEPW